MPLFMKGFHALKNGMLFYHDFFMKLSKGRRNERIFGYNKALIGPLFEKLKEFVMSKVFVQDSQALKESSW